MAELPLDMLLRIVQGAPLHHLPSLALVSKAWSEAVAIELQAKFQVLETVARYNMEEDYSDDDEIELDFEGLLNINRAVSVLTTAVRPRVRHFARTGDLAGFTELIETAKYASYNVGEFNEVYHLLPESKLYLENYGHDDCESLVFHGLYSTSQAMIDYVLKDEDFNMRATGYFELQQFISGATAILDNCLENGWYTTAFEVHLRQFRDHPTGELWVTNKVIDGNLARPETSKNTKAYLKFAGKWGYEHNVSGPQFASKVRRACGGPPYRRCAMVFDQWKSYYGRR